MQISQIIFLRGQDVLLGYRQNVQAENERWGFPSGRIEPGEAPVDAAIREAKEEVNVVVENLTALLDLNDAHGKQHRFFLCTEWTGTLRNAEPELCREIRWFPFANLPPGCTAITYQALDLIREKSPALALF